MNKIAFVLCINLLLSQVQVDAQEKVYFDRNGKRSSVHNALYYRGLQPDSSDWYSAFYVNGNGIYFKGRIASVNNQNESKNVYAGTCIWYFKNGQPERIVEYNEGGLKHGTERSYHDNGQLKVERRFEEGRGSRDPIVEFSENGERSQIFTDLFEDNYNDWDLYESDFSRSTISHGRLLLSAKSTQGSSRYITFPRPESSIFSIESSIENVSVKKSFYGLLLGFKDWNNYSFFVLKGSYYLAGSVIEGIYSGMQEPMFSSQINAKGFNTLKVLKTEDQVILSINGMIVNRRQMNFAGNKHGLIIAGKGEIQAAQISLKSLGENSISENKDIQVKSTGTAFFIHRSGYLATNFHVIDNAKRITVEIIENGSPAIYNAQILVVDKSNDLAILKINNENFRQLDSLRYQIKRDGLPEVGSGAFTLGFPLALSGMGKEVKFADGKISSRTGYNQEINSYQTSVPVQPGNSGGPLFNEKGQLIGVMNSKFKDADNVSYAIKVNFLVNLVELLEEPLNLPNHPCSEISLEEKIKQVKDLVVIIKSY